MKPANRNLLDLVEKLNNDPRINGVLVQLPLPKHIDENKVIMAINPKKDVDGFHPVNIGRLMIGDPDFLPATPYGIKVLLQRAGVETSGAEVVVIGRSNIVGKPIANILMQKGEGANATVTVCHTRTKDLAFHTKRADILIVAAGGKPRAITADMVKEGVVVIDVGHSSNRHDGRGKEYPLWRCRFRFGQGKGKGYHPRSARRRPDDYNNAYGQHSQSRQDGCRLVIKPAFDIIRITNIIYRVNINSSELRNY